MALTMTRTRNQTTLNKLAQRVAEIHDELAVLDQWLADTAESCAAVARKITELQGHRDALYLTLKQFDASLDPSAIGRNRQWLKKYGHGKPALQRYRKHLDEAETKA